MSKVKKKRRKKMLFRQCKAAPGARCEAEEQKGVGGLMGWGG